MGWGGMGRSRMGGRATAFTAPATPPCPLSRVIPPLKEFSQCREPLTVLAQEPDSLWAPLQCRHNPNKSRFSHGQDDEAKRRN